MTMQLTQELVKALHAAGMEGREVVDPETNRTYRIVDAETHRRAMTALQAQENREAIAEGLAQFEAGQARSAEEVFAEIRDRLGFPQQT